MLSPVDPATRIALALFVLAVALAAILLTLRRSKRRRLAAIGERIAGKVAEANEARRIADAAHAKASALRR